MALTRHAHFVAKHASKFPPNGLRRPVQKYPVVQLTVSSEFTVNYPATGEDYGEFRGHSERVAYLSTC